MACPQKQSEQMHVEEKKNIFEVEVSEMVKLSMSNFMLTLEKSEVGLIEIKK